MDLWKIEFGSVGWVDLARETVVNTVMNLRIP
jgi:hypothetical protein